MKTFEQIVKEHIKRANEFFCEYDEKPVFEKIAKSVTIEWLQQIYDKYSKIEDAPELVNEDLRLLTELMNELESKT